MTDFKCSNCGATFRRPEGARPETECAVCRWRIHDPSQPRGVDHAPLRTTAEGAEDTKT